MTGYLGWYFLGLLCGGLIGIVINLTSIRGDFSDPVPVPGGNFEFQCSGSVKVFGVTVLQVSGPTDLVYRTVQMRVQWITSMVMLVAGVGGVITALGLRPLLRRRSGVG